MLVQIGLLYFVKEVKLFILIVSVLNFYVPKEIKEFIKNKNIKANIFQVQSNNSIIRGYFCIGFIDFMLAGKKLIDFTSMFSPYEFEKSDSIVLSYFKDE